MPTNPKPTSSTRSDTARANGAKSHGPATPEGRARSSQNALRHGLATRAASLPPMSIVLPEESPADFQRLLDSYLDEFAPTSPIEVELVEAMASARWRLRRLANVETTLLTNEMETSVDDLARFFAGVDRETDAEDHLAYAFKRLAGGASLHLLNRYEGTIGRSYARAFKQLQLLRTLRIRVQPNEPKQSLSVELSRRPGAILTNETNDKSAPALPPVLQTPPQPAKTRLEPQQLRVPALQISPPPADSRL